MLSLSYTYEGLIPITATKQKKTRKIAVITAAAVCGLAAIALIGNAVWGLALKNSSVIFPNVYVAGVNVGGMSASEAKSAVDRAVAEKYNTPMEIRLPDTTLILEPEQVAVTLDAEPAVERAVDYGRTGNIFSAVLTRLQTGGW